MNLFESTNDGWPTHPLFHGTPTREAAMSIMENGLRPQGGDSRWSGDLTAINGRSYLSGSLFHVLEGYVFASGHEGYVLVFDADQIQDSYPDEDAVVSFINSFITCKFGNEDVVFEIKNVDNDIRYVCEKLISILMALKPEQRVAMFYGTASQRRKLPIAFGKNVLKILNKDYLDIIRANDHHERHAVSEILMPVSCWLVTREIFKDMSFSVMNKQQDWLTFRDHATRVQ
jgi:hypothetical protein